MSSAWNHANIASLDLSSIVKFDDEAVDWPKSRARTERSDKLIPIDKVYVSLSARKAEKPKKQFRPITTVVPSLEVTVDLQPLQKKKEAKLPGFLDTDSVVSSVTKKIQSPQISPSTKGPAQKTNSSTPKNQKQMKFTFMAYGNTNNTEIHEESTLSELSVSNNGLGVGRVQITAPNVGHIKSSKSAFPRRHILKQYSPSEPPQRQLISSGDQDAVQDDLSESQSASPKESMKPPEELNQVVQLISAPQSKQYKHLIPNVLTYEPPASLSSNTSTTAVHAVHDVDTFDIALSRPLSSMGPPATTTTQNSSVQITGTRNNSSVRSQVGLRGRLYKGANSTDSIATTASRESRRGNNSSHRKVSAQSTAVSVNHLLGSNNDIQTDITVMVDKPKSAKHHQTVMEEQRALVADLGHDLNRPLTDKDRAAAAAAAAMLEYDDIDQPPFEFGLYENQPTSPMEFDEDYICRILSTAEQKEHRVGSAILHETRANTNTAPLNPQLHLSDKATLQLAMVNDNIVWNGDDLSTHFINTERTNGNNNKTHESQNSKAVGQRENNVVGGVNKTKRETNPHPYDPNISTYSIISSVLAPGGSVINTVTKKKLKTTGKRQQNAPPQQPSCHTHDLVLTPSITNLSGNSTTDHPFLYTRQAPKVLIPSGVTQHNKQKVPYTVKLPSKMQYLSRIYQYKHRQFNNNPQTASGRNNKGHQTTSKQHTTGTTVVETGDVSANVSMYDDLSQHIVQQQQSSDMKTAPLLMFTNNTSEVIRPGVKSAYESSTVSGLRADGAAAQSNRSDRSTHMKQQHLQHQHQRLEHLSAIDTQTIYSKPGSDMPVLEYYDLLHGSRQITEFRQPEKRILSSHSPPRSSRKDGNIPDNKKSQLDYSELERSVMSSNTPLRVPTAPLQSPTDSVTSQETFTFELQTIDNQHQQPMQPIQSHLSQLPPQWQQNNHDNNNINSVHGSSNHSLNEDGMSSLVAGMSSYEEYITDENRDELKNIHSNVSPQHLEKADENSLTSMNKSIVFDDSATNSPNKQYNPNKSIHFDFASDDTSPTVEVISHEQSHGSVIEAQNTQTSDVHAHTDTTAKPQLSSAAESTGYVYRGRPLEPLHSITNGDAISQLVSNLVDHNLQQKQQEQQYEEQFSLLYQQHALKAPRQDPNAGSGHGHNNHKETNHNSNGNGERAKTASFDATLQIPTPQIQAKQPPQITSESLIEALSVNVINSIMKSPTVSNVNKQMEPQSAIDILNDTNNTALLTQFECSEILDYKEIYFLGSDKYHKIQPHLLVPPEHLHVSDPTVTGTAPQISPTSAAKLNTIYSDYENGVFNSGFDNEDSNYIAVENDHIGYRYEILSLLGKGSFSDVYKCKDHKFNKHVALKVVKSKPRFQSQAAHELAMLDYVNPAKHKELYISNEAVTSKGSATGSKTTKSRMSVINDSQQLHTQSRTTTANYIMTAAEVLAAQNAARYEVIKSIIVQYTDEFTFRNHPCFVFPLYSLNLYEYLKAKDFVGLPVGFIKKVTIQLLEGLSYLKRINIIHCDLKPENILIRDERTASILICDFGSSCKVGEATHTYIQSRFYRAPEVLLGIEYGPEIDMWSLACIIAELRIAYPAFPGESERDQVATIAEVLGQPPYILYEKSTRKKELFNDFYKLILYFSPSGKDRQCNTRSIASLINARIQDDLFVSFLTNILQWLPEKRMQPDDALRHPWLIDRLESNVADNHHRHSQQQQQQARHTLFQGNTAHLKQQFTAAGETNNEDGDDADLLPRLIEQNKKREADESDLERMNAFLDVFSYDADIGTSAGVGAAVVVDENEGQIETKEALSDV